MSAYLATDNLDIQASGTRENVRFPNGIQIEYGYVGFDPGVQSRELNYLRPFISDLTTGVASWRFANESQGYATFTEMSNTYFLINCWGKDTGTNLSRSCSYIVIGRWK